MNLKHKTLNIKINESASMTKLYSICQPMTVETDYSENLSNSD